MEIKNTGLDAAALARQHTGSAAKQTRAEESGGRPGDEDRVTLSTEAETLQPAENSGRVVDFESARELVMRLREQIADDGAAALAAHGNLSEQSTRLLAAG